jgi:hypothetical protein
LKSRIIFAMAIVTSQKIGAYYEQYKAIDIVFSKEIIQVSGLVTNQVFLKCAGDVWPCVVYSSSFQGAKVVVNTKSGILQKLERANNMTSLRFCFKVADKTNRVTFFVTARAVGNTPYGGSSDAALFTLQFTQRPPDDLIEIMGRILDANVASAKRRDERIIVSTDSARKLGLVSKECAIFIQGVPRNCILRDISFSGAKLIMMGVAKFIVNKEAALRIDFDDPRESFLMKGTFLRSEPVEGRKELVALVVHFDEGSVPMGYRIRLNDYLSVTRADERGSETMAKDDPASKKPAAPRPAAPAPAAARPKPAQSEWPSPDEAAGAAGAKLPVPAATPAAANAKPPAQAASAAKPGAAPAAANAVAKKPASADDAFNLDLPVK